MNSTKTESQRLRDFGLLFSAIFALVGCVKVFKYNPNGSIYAAIGAIFLLAALGCPKALYWPEKLWMKFGDFMSAIMTRVMVFLLFSLAITPLAYIMRLIGRNPLKLDLDKSASTYWEPFAKDGPGSRPFSPF